MQLAPDDDNVAYVLYAPTEDVYCGSLGTVVAYDREHNSSIIGAGVICYTVKGISGLEDIDHDFGDGEGESHSINIDNINEVLAVGEYDWWIVTVIQQDSGVEKINFVDSDKLCLDRRGRFR